MFKKIFVIGILASSITTSNQVMAEIVWKGTSLWQSPVSTSTVRHLIVTQHSELFDSCTEFRKQMDKIVNYPDEERRIDFEATRREPLNNSWPQMAFTYEFKTDIPLSGNVLNESKLELAKMAAEKKQNTPLQISIQNAEEVLIQDLRSVSFTQSQETGLLKTARDLNLEPLPTKLVIKSGDGVYLNVIGKDTACDIINGSAQLLTVVNARARVGLDEQVKLKDFFYTISELTIPVLKKYMKPSSRAAMLGYYFGKYLESKFPDNTVEVNDQIIADLIETFFEQKTMSFNGLWGQSPVGPLLTFDAFSEIFQVSLKLTATK